MITGDESELGVVSEGISVELPEIWIEELDSFILLTPKIDADLLGASKYSLYKFSNRISKSVWELEASDSWSLWIALECNLK